MHIIPWKFYTTQVNIGKIVIKPDMYLNFKNETKVRSTKIFVEYVTVLFFTKNFQTFSKYPTEKGNP